MKHKALTPSVRPGDPVVSARIPHEQYEELRHRAAAAHRSLSGELRLIIERHLADDQARRHALEQAA